MRGHESERGLFLSLNRKESRTHSVRQKERVILHPDHVRKYVVGRWATKGGRINLSYPQWKGWKGKKGGRREKKNIGPSSEH